MAQFKKHLFGTSYFGYSNTFEGVYTLPTIDAEEKFDGTIDFAVKADLPLVTYTGAQADWIKSPLSAWSVNGTQLVSRVKDSQASFYLSADQFRLHFSQRSGNAMAKIELYEIGSTKTLVFTETINTSTENFFEKKVPYALYLLVITNTEEKTLQIEQIQARVTTFKIQTRTSVDGVTWSAFTDSATQVEGSGGQWTGESKPVVQQRFVQGRLLLATSDGLISPSIDKVRLSSGDTTKYTSDGYWFSAIDLKEVAKEKGKTFLRAKRVEWKEHKETSHQVDLRSTSTSNSFPNKEQVADLSYWKDETAVYVVDRSDLSKPYGEPWSRVALKEGQNLSSFLSFPLSAKQFKLANTKLKEWLYWNDQSFYPLNPSGTNLKYEFFLNQSDANEGIPPLLTITDAPNEKNRALHLPEEYQDQPLFIRVSFYRTNARQTPVLDFLDCYGAMRYANHANLAIKQIQASAVTLNQEAIAYAEIKANQLNWPSNIDRLPENQTFVQSSTRTYTIDYQSKYPGQLELYFDSKKTASSNRHQVQTKATDQGFKDILRVKIMADTPTASTQKASSHRLTYHYAYDGAMVLYPKETNQELSSDFTPDLLTGKKYRFRLSNGWPNQTQVVPFAMDWETFAETYQQELLPLKNLNEDVKLYNGLLPSGIEITLTNTTLNEKVLVQFKNGQNNYTDASIWNGVKNDLVVGHIPTAGDFQYEEWISEEKTFIGYLNPNDERGPYIRSHLIGGESGKETIYVIKDGDTYASIAKAFNVHPFDLQKKNKMKTLIPEETLLIPVSFSLPTINPEAIFDNLNPYTVELIPYSVQTKSGEILADSTVVLGSDDEEALSYTYQTSETVRVYLTRGQETNGRDALPFANVSKIIQVKGNDGKIYVPATTHASGSNTGDYELIDNYLDWKSHNSQSSEPMAGEQYEVWLQYQTISSIRLVMTSPYKEKISQNRLWRSEEIKVFNGLVMPNKDFRLLLPDKTAFKGYNQRLMQVSYLVEDNDLWVNTRIETIDDKSYLVATMNGEDPKRNWYPTIQTGFYYLNDEEYYLYSEPMTTTYDERDLPIIKDVLYETNGLQVQPSYKNLLTNSALVLKEETFERVY